MHRTGVEAEQRRGTQAGQHAGESCKRARTRVQRPCQ
jgi:hypothetical protein